MSPDSETNPHESPETPPESPAVDVQALTFAGCVLVLITAFLGWMFAGMQMAVTSLVMHNAASTLLIENADGGEVTKGEIGQWFGFLVCAFLMGAATGGYLFGWVGDRIGRSKAMAMSILCYSLFAGLTWFARTPEELFLLRFLTCMGIGGMWPNGIALVSEAWPNISRPFLAGAIGTAANVGILLFATMTLYIHVTPETWRWTMLFGLAPAVLGVFAWFCVPESPRWLALRERSEENEKPRLAVGMSEVFRPPLLKVTVIGILLGAVPLFGGWGVSNWATAWASENAETSKSEEHNETEETKKQDPTLKSWSVIYRSLPGSISSLLGGAVAMLLGRRRFYFILCLCALVCTQFLFRLDSPTDEGFKIWMGLLGFFSGFFFGWLPLCLPELFPTRVRSTGAGVSFNFGRILTTIGVLASAFMLKAWLKGSYTTVGQICGLVYAVGLIVIWFAPVSESTELED